jgi:hypothetical protein
VGASHKGATATLTLVLVRSYVKDLRSFICCFQPGSGTGCRIGLTNDESVFAVREAAKRDQSLIANDQPTSQVLLA